MSIRKFLTGSNRSGNPLESDFRRLLDEYRAIEPGEAVHPVDAFFCYRILLGRHPSRGAELPALLAMGNTTYREFLSNLLDSDEYGKQVSFLPGNHLFMAELPEFRFWFNTSDREMGVRMATGQYEPETVALLPRFVPSGATCIDVGAQTGFFTLHMARLAGPTGRVYAFEPFPQSLNLLEKNVRENRLSESVRLMPNACSSTDGTLRFIEASGMLVAARDSDTNVRSVRVVRVDDVVDRPVAFVKLDAEGHEPAVLQGMTRILAKDRPVILTEVNEYWLRRAGSSGREYMNILESYGYALQRVEDASRIEPATVTLGELETLNLLATPAERSVG